MYRQRLLHVCTSAASELAGFQSNASMVQGITKKKMTKKVFFYTYSRFRENIINSWMISYKKTRRAKWNVCAPCWPYYANTTFGAAAI